MNKPIAYNPKSVELDSEAFEQKYVQEIYDQIADHFDQTRYRVWTKAQEFFDKIISTLNLKPPETTKILEVGCGNGKNLQYLYDNCPTSTAKVELYGCDLCQRLCQVVQSRLTADYINIVVADQLDLPYRDNYVDYTFSIAVIHHLSTQSRRQRAINELIRVTKPGGQIFIQVWALEQDQTARRQFTQGDNLVPWEVTKDSQKARLNRYYHVFSEGELKLLLQDSISSGQIKVDNSFYDFGNWGVLLTKT